MWEAHIDHLFNGRHEGAHTHIVGNSQRCWLEAELMKPAELRLIAIGLSVVAEGAGREEACRISPRIDTAGFL